MFSERSSTKFYIFVILITLLIFLFAELSFRGGVKLKALYKYRSFQNNYNLCMVGGSTAIGVPFNEKVSIPQLVSYAFNDTINNKQVVSHNLGEAGMPISTAYWNTRELAMGLEEGTILLYTGINDTYKADDNPGLFFFKIFQKSWLLSRLGYLFNPWNGSRAHYEYYYENILKILEAKEWKVISSTLVGNYSEFAPNMYNKELLATNYFRETKEDNAGFPLSYSFITDSMRFFNEDAFLFYLNGRSFLENQEVDSANKYFTLAVNADNSIRPSSYKNQFIHEVSEKYNIPCVDANKVFDKKSGPALPGYDLFMDAHHPTLEGYLIISSLFVDSLEQIHTTKRIHELDLIKLEHEFNLDVSFYARANLETAIWHILESFYTESYRDRLSKAAEFLQSVDKEECDVGKYIYWKGLLLFLQEDFENWSYFYKTNEAKMDFSYPIRKVSNFERIEEIMQFGIDDLRISKELKQDFLSKLN